MINLKMKYKRLYKLTNEILNQHMFVNYQIFFPSFNYLFKSMIPKTGTIKAEIPNTNVNIITIGDYLLNFVIKLFKSTNPAVDPIIHHNPIHKE